MSKDLCLTADQLRKLLRDDTSESDDPQILEHVEACADCRQTLDQLAGPVPTEESTQEIRNAYEFYQTAKRTEKPSSSQAADQTATQGFVSKFLREIGIREKSSDIKTSGSPVVGRIDNVDLHHLLGRGGMGVVFKGRDSILDRDVAVKIIEPSFSRDPEARQRFLQEARLAASINHPNVVKIHAINDSGTTPALIMEFVDGTSLQDLVGEPERPDESTIRKIAQQATEGLAAAHAKKIIHRDIKPGNLLLEKDTNRIKIADFGLAFVSERASYITCDGVVLGTPEYMSPEQVRGQPLDARSDLFSLGAVLYELCTGKLPFAGQTVMSIAYNVVNEPIMPVKKVNPDVSDGFAVIVERLLNKSPEMRFQTANQLIEALAGVVQDKATPLSSRVYRLAAIAGIIVMSVAGIYGAIEFSSSFDKADRRTANKQNGLNDHAIQIEGRNDGFADLATAIQSSKSNETILLQGGRGYRLELREIQTRSLTIRSTGGQRAKIILPEAQDDDDWLSLTGDLTFQDIDIEAFSTNRPGQNRKQSAIAISNSGSIHLRNCRMVTTGFIGAIFMNGGKLQVTDSCLFAPEGIGIASQSKGQNEVIMNNALIVSRNAMLWSFDSRTDLGDEEISLTSSTIRSNTIFKLHQDRRGGSPSRRSTPIKVSSTQTVFSGEHLIEVEPRIRFSGKERPFSDFLNNALDWTGEKNLYSKDLKFLVTTMSKMDVDPKNADEWSQLWKDRERQSAQEMLEFTGPHQSTEAQDHVVKTTDAAHEAAVGRIGFSPEPAK